MSEKNKRAYIIVRRILRQKDRTLLYGSQTDYFVIAPTRWQGELLDEVAYEPYGYNYGFFIENARER